MLPGNVAFGRNNLTGRLHLQRENYKYLIQLWVCLNSVTLITVPCENSESCACGIATRDGGLVWYIGLLHQGDSHSCPNVDLLPAPELYRLFSQLLLKRDT